MNSLTATALAFGVHKWMSTEDQMPIYNVLQTLNIRNIVQIKFHFNHHLWASTGHIGISIAY